MIIPRRAVKILETGELYRSVAACARAIDGDRKAVDKAIRTRSWYLGHTFRWVSLTPEQDRTLFWRDRS